MIYLRPEEIKEVKKNLRIFDGLLKDRFIKELLSSKEIRYEKHGLFFSLCNPKVWSFLKQALVSIKDYDGGKNFAKATRKLIKASDWLEHKSVVAEIIVVGYYCNKFQKNKSVEVVWERKINDKGGNVDISILGFKNNINIEITVLHDVAEYRNFFELRDEIKIALEQMSESFEVQKFAYLFSLPDKSVFSKSNISEFANFVKLMRETKGVGEYLFEYNGEVLATVKILLLNKLKTEYASNIDIFSRWNEDWRRIQDKISEKVTRQLPKGEINFVCMPALDIWTDDYEAERAMLGTEKLVINKYGEGNWAREADDVSKILSQISYDSLYGLIYFNWDYSKKKIIGNPTKKLEGEVKKVVGLIE